MKSTAALAFTWAVSCVVISSVEAAPPRGWLSWRGPEQTGVSRETGLPDKVEAKDALWVADFPGQAAVTVADNKVYAMGYVGEGADLQEGIGCFDANTGKKLWQQVYNDYLSDSIYLRYATASPEIDPETGNIFMQGTQGILASFSPDGKVLWRRPMMEEFGRLTFPNSRTATPAIDGDFVITRGITANWGANGPAADRFYAFDKRTGELVWVSTPGGPPKDNSFSHPQFGWYRGMRVFFSACGDGSVVCANARTGDPIWRVNLFRAGINPLRPSHRLRKAQWTSMWSDLVELMRYGVETGRIDTVRPEHTPEAMGRPPRQDDHGGEVYVYRRTGQPCLVCGSTVRTDVLVGRNIFWCPQCQRRFRSRALQ